MLVSGSSVHVCQSVQWRIPSQPQIVERRESEKPGSCSAWRVISFRHLQMPYGLSVCLCLQGFRQDHATELHRIGRYPAPFRFRTLTVLGSKPIAELQLCVTDLSCHFRSSLTPVRTWYSYDDSSPNYYESSTGITRVENEAGFNRAQEF